MKKKGQADLGPKRKGLDLRLSYDIIIKLNTKLRDIWIGSCGTHEEANKEGVGFLCFETRCDCDLGVGTIYCYLIEGATLSSDGCWAQFRIQRLVCHFLGSPR